MERVVRRRHQVYDEHDFEIRSLTSLVEDAKEKTHERMASEDDPEPIELPLHLFTERVIDSLQIMHHHIQSMLMQKMGPDARNVITAERARWDRDQKERFRHVLRRKEEQFIGRRLKTENHMANHLSEVGRDTRDELELLNDYREQYAGILAELLVAKDRLISLEKTIRKSTHGNLELNRRISTDLAQLDESEDDWKGRSRIARWPTASDNLEPPRKPDIALRRLS
jgi:hypothetical protein